jgi:hypothetical protein
VTEPLLTFHKQAGAAGVNAPARAGAPFEPAHVSQEDCMFPLKPLHPDAIPEAMMKAERYRLLNEPVLAESICRDVLLVEPTNQQAIVWLLLSLGDQFAGPYKAMTVREARSLLARLFSAYERSYYAGVIRERQAKARLREGGPGAGFEAYELLREAMEYYEEAEKVRPADNDDTILRWNSCARIIDNNPEVRPRPEGEIELLE